MRFEGQFRLPGSPVQVLEAFADVERMVKCMPGASVDGKDSEGNYLGSMVVAFGPKKIRFKGRIKSSITLAEGSGWLDVRGAADMRMTAPANVYVTYKVREESAAESPTSVVSLVSEAELGGVLEDFARTGGIVVTQALMEMFAERVAQEFGRPSGTARPASIEVPPAGSPQSSHASVHPTPLPAGRLLWMVLRTKFLAIGRWIKRQGA